MNQADLKFDDVYHLEAIMRIFDKTSQTSIMGSEPSRMRNRYGWTVFNIHQKLAFWRREIQTTALLLDAMDAGRLPKPYSTSLWPDYVAGYRDPEHFRKLLSAVEAAPLPRYHKCLLEASTMDESTPQNVLIADFWTVEQMADAIGISRESVYKRSDIRLGPGLGLKTVQFAEMSLWHPLKQPLIAGNEST